MKRTTYQAMKAWQDASVSAKAFTDAHRHASEPSPTAAPTSSEWRITMWCSKPAVLITVAVLAGLGLLALAVLGWPF